MKIAGIILLILGGFSTLGDIIVASRGHKAPFAGLSFIVLGLFLISRANKNKEEAEKKKKWVEGNINENE